MEPRTVMGKLHQRVLGGAEDGMAGRPWAFGMDGKPTSVITREGADPVSVGLLDHQLTENWALPNIKILSRAQRADTLLSKVLGGPDKVPAALGDAFVEGLWKPALLLRMAFG